MTGYAYAPHRFSTHGVGSMLAHWLLRAAVWRFVWSLPFAVVAVLGLVALVVVWRSRGRRSR